MESDPLRAGFLHTGTTDIWGRIILWCRELPVHCRILNSIPGLYPLDARSSIQLLHKKCLQGFPGGSVVKNPPANAGDTGSSPGPGRSHMLRSN